LCQGGGDAAQGEGHPNRYHKQGENIERMRHIAFHKNELGRLLQQFICCSVICLIASCVCFSSQQKGDTALHVASGYGFADVVEMLLKVKDIRTDITNKVRDRATRVCLFFTPHLSFTLHSLL
jgi:hypothetical protein